MKIPFWKRFYRTFVSRRTTVLLIVILTCFYFLGLLIPQQAIMPPEQFAVWQAKHPELVRTLISLKITSIYSSPYVLTITAVFFLNLVLVTAQRIPSVIREIRLPSSEAVTPELLRTAQATVRYPLGEGKSIGRFHDALRAKGFVVSAGEDRFLGVKNRYATWGSILFHASFIVMLVGGLLIFHIRFRGEAVVAEGQFFSGARDEYRTRMRISDLRTELPDIRFAVEKIEPRFEKMEAVTLRADIRAEGAKGSVRGSLDVNKPFTYGSTSVLITDVGIAPLFVMVDAGGQEEFGAYVNLNIMRGEKDYFTIPGTDMKVNVSFWSDAVEDGREIRTVSYDLRNPLFHISVTKNGKVVQSGSIRGKNDFLEVDGKRLLIPDIRHYGTFLIIDEHGGGALIAGFVMAIVGSMIKLLWNRRVVMGLVIDSDGKRELQIVFRQEYYQSGAQSELQHITMLLEAEHDRT